MNKAHREQDSSITESSNTSNTNKINSNNSKNAKWFFSHFTRLHSTILVIFICLLPVTLNLFGVDFASTKTPIPIEKITSNTISANDLFYALSGALHHTILEWSAVILAMLAFVISIVHYRIRGDVAIPVIGMALFCAGSVDAFHTLAATRILEAKAANTDFIPFTWAFSRIFNSIIMITGTLLSFWLYKKYDHPNSVNEGQNKHGKTLILIGFCFVLVAYISVHLAANSESLPQTMFTKALITRPYDVLPLGFFILAGVLFWNLYRINPSLAKFGLLLSVCPEIITQIHMAFGSAALFDNHFNIAHALKIVAYGSVFLGIAFDLKANIATQSVSKEVTKQFDTNALVSKKAIPGIIEIGKTKHSLIAQISAGGFLLAISITILVTMLFYNESERLLIQQEHKELTIEAKLVEPIIEQLYSQAYADLLFLSNTPPVMGLIKAHEANDQVNYQLWHQRLTQIFIELSKAKKQYFQLSYVKFDNNGSELAKVKNIGNGPIQTPNSRLSKGSTDIINATSNLNLGEVYFSSIALLKENERLISPQRPLLSVATPVFSSLGEVFGAIVIKVDFNHLAKELKSSLPAELSYFLANQNGDYLVHPDPEKTFAFEFGEPVLIQDEFLQIKEAMNNDLQETYLDDVFIKESQYVGQYHLMDLDRFGHTKSIRLVILRDLSSMLADLESLKIRSVLLGFALTIVAFGLTLLVSRRIANPINSIITTLEEYENNNTSIGNLPIGLNNEIGIMARNFHNLFIRMEDSLLQHIRLNQESEFARERVSAILNSTVDAFITINEKSNITSFNQAAESMFGCKEADVIGENVKLLMPSSYATEHDNFIENNRTSGIDKIIGIGRELEAIHKSGHVFPIHLAITKVEGEEGVTYTGVIRDISKEKTLEEQRLQREKEIEKINERIGLATQAANIGIWEFDLTKFSSDWDEGMHNLYGLDSSKTSPETIDWHSFLHPDDIERSVALMTQATEQVINFSDEYRIVLADNQVKYIKAVGVVKADDKGVASKIIGVNYDISEIKLAALAHLHAKEAAEATAQHKAEFLASMSHEIRTPMNGVLGMLGLLNRSKLDEDQQHRVQLATSSAESLLTLINDILDFSKVEAGKLDLEMLDFDLRHMLGVFAETMAFKAQEKGLEFILDVNKINQSHVKGDPGRIRQILTNIVGNAIKFTQQGEITIRAHTTELDNNQILFECDVCDTGIGIPRNKVPHLFESFTQVDASTTRKFGGTGLGLAISKQLCHLMSGDISVRSQPDLGSVFSFQLILTNSQESSPVIPNVDVEGVNLLVVDDNETNRIVLREQLELWGANVTEVDNGISALSLLEKADIDFKVAFLDMQMPYMDGAELGKCIRNLPNLTDLKLVMMTSMATRGDAKFFADIGFDAYFPKPTTTADLFDTLALTLSDSELIQQAEPLITHHFLSTCKHEKPAVDTGVDNLASVEQLENSRILLVEDNRINQEVARAVLSEFNVNVDIAADGLEALQSLKLAAEDTPYDLILMDCQMPEMDGYQASGEIRAGAAGGCYSNIPIIAMTANAMIGDKEKCLAAGMDDYLTKPIDPISLKKKLIFWLNQSHQVRETQPQSVLQTPLVKEESSSIQSSKDIDNQSNIWQKDKLLQRISNNELMLEKLLQLFIEEMPPLFIDYNQAYKELDYDAMREVIHKIKGISGNVSAMDLHKKTIDIEALLANESINEQAHQTLKDSYQSIFELLEQELVTSPEN